MFNIHPEQTLKEVETIPFPVQDTLQQYSSGQPKTTPTLDSETAGLELYEAANTNDIQKLHHLLNAGADVNYQTDPGLTPLHIASYRQYVDIVKSLLQVANIDVNIQDNQGRTALHFAVDKGDIQVVKLLLANRSVNINLQTVVGNSPAHQAAFHASNQSHHDIFSLLLHRQADTTIKNQSGETPIDLLRVVSIV